MKQKYIQLFLLVSFLLPSRVVLADTGPKPTMEFTFTGTSATILSGIMYECDQSDCSDAELLRELGPQRFTCNVDGCRATAYGFAPYHKIEVKFSDGITRQSNVFETTGFNSKYTVTVQPTELVVKSRFNLNVNPYTSICILACVCLGAAIAIIASVIVLIRKRQTKA